MKRTKRVIGCCFLVFAWMGFGQDSANSPFKTPVATPPVDAGAPEAAVTTLDSFQFNGIMKLGGETRISLFDTKTNKNYWIREGELGELGLSVQRFDEGNETVVVTQGGISKKLSLNKVKIEELKIAAAPAPTPANAPAATVARPPSAERVETDEEARARIQRVAEEIRRRRAERRAQLEARQQGR